MARARMLTGFHRIELEISHDRWASVAGQVFYFGKHHRDNQHEAFKKASDSLEVHQKADPRGKYRIKTFGMLQ